VTTTKLFGVLALVAGTLASNEAFARIHYVKECSGPSWLTWGNFCAGNTFGYMLGIFVFFSAIKLTWMWLRGDFR
jgi:hypothetical protein